MKKILGYILTPIVVAVYYTVLLILHPIQWVAYNWFGYAAHKKTVDALNFFLVSSVYLAGISVSFTNRQNLPVGRPIIFVANHQSMFDISPIIWFLRKHHLKFISKKELASGIPSISYNLKYGGAANIDRKDPRQSIMEIARLGTNMKEKNWSAAIFPEGTRSKDGSIKPFQAAGVATLLKKCPGALIVPIAINNAWKAIKYGYFPLNAFTHMSLEVLEPIEPGTSTADEIVLEAENRIRKALRQPLRS